MKRVVSETHLEDKGLLELVEDIRTELTRVCEIVSDDAAEAEILEFVRTIGARIHSGDVYRSLLPFGAPSFTLSPSEELVAALEALRAWNGEGPIFPEAA